MRGGHHVVYLSINPDYVTGAPARELRLSLRDAEMLSDMIKSAARDLSNTIELDESELQKATTAETCSCAICAEIHRKIDALSKVVDTNVAWIESQRDSINKHTDTLLDGLWSAYNHHVEQTALYDIEQHAKVEQLEAWALRMTRWAQLATDEINKAGVTLPDPFPWNPKGGDDV